MEGAQKSIIADLDHITFYFLVEITQFSRYESLLLPANILK
jgi:hypothetical protein